MPIIGKVGRKSFKVKILNISLHTILLVGGITMIYPFLMMVSASFKSNVDSKYFDIIPKYFYDDNTLYQKYIESRFNENSYLLKSQYQGKYYSFEFVKTPEYSAEQINNDWIEFIEENKGRYNEYDFIVAEQFANGIFPRNAVAFKEKVHDEFDGNITGFNKKYGISALYWDDVTVFSKEELSRRFTSEKTGINIPYSKFREDLPNWHKIWLSLDGDFVNYEIIPTYRNNLRLFNELKGTDFSSWSDITLSKTLPNDSLRGHWIEYVKNTLNTYHIKLNSRGVENYIDFVKNKYQNIDLVNKTWMTDLDTFEDLISINHYIEGAASQDYSFFIENLADPEHLIISSVEFDFRDWLKNKYNDIDNLTKAYEKSYKNFDNVTLTDNYPEYNIAVQDDWKGFVLNKLDISQIEISMKCQHEFIEFLKSKFGEKLNLEKVNDLLGTNYKSIVNIYPQKSLPENIEQRKIWTDFVINFINPKFITINSSKVTGWSSFLKNKYHDIENLNKKYHLKFTSFQNIHIDYQIFDHQIFLEHKSDIFYEFLFRNYRLVLDSMLLNGRAVVNTLIYCLLAILAAIIINPLAAYAMSRFKLKANYKIILILMLTMAFPPMVMGIPNFLLLKKLGMLNTFWALILPAAADGYFIFLLKGFFDSLPKELFESATMDGAGEVRIFFRIAMSLSKPIMAVIALGAFNAAYRNFMFAFIVCQDKSMWTMMVHIYQLMQRSSVGVGYAALVIAAIPTFAVFIFFQNIIIKGIVVPTEK